MRRVILPLAALLLWSAPAAAEPLKFSPLPMETPYTVASQWKPLLSYLENSLGIVLEIDYSLSNDEIVAKFEAGQLDLAYFGPLPYLKLKREFPAAEPLVVFHEKSGQPFYTCAMVVSGSHPLRLEKITGKSFALTQPLSTCGYFATQGMLRERGNSLENNRYRYIGQHDEVALSVVRGEFDIGGLKTAIARKYSHLGLKILAESPPLPGLALVANTERVSPELVRRIREALLAASDAERAQWGDNIRHGISAVSDQDYDGIRRLSIPAEIPQQGNF